MGVVMQDAIISGVVAALIYTVIAFIVRAVWGAEILPRIKEFLYKDVEIEGAWEINYPDSDRKEAINLERNAHDVSGTIVSLEGPEQGKTYSLKGDFYNGILTASYRTLDKGGLDRGTFALYVNNDGYILKGNSSFYDDDTRGITSEECQWEKKK